MKVLVIVKATKDSEAGIMPGEQLIADMTRFNEELTEAGVMLAGEGLKPSSKGARVHFSGKNRTVVDGPFAETKELIAGFWLWRVKSLQEAIEWLKKCPSPHEEDCHVEIRPMFDVEDFGDAFTPELREREAALRAQPLGLETPRYENTGPLTIVGVKQNYSCSDKSGIPAQWEAFAPRIGHIPGQLNGMTAFGVCSNFDDQGRFDYLCGVEVPPGTTGEPDRVELPACRYAVFTHPGHISKIGKTLETIWNSWVPDAEVRVGRSPWFERYTEEFNPETGFGGTEIWVPLVG